MLNKLLLLQPSTLSMIFYPSPPAQLNLPLTTTCFSPEMIIFIVLKMIKRMFLHDKEQPHCYTGTLFNFNKGFTLYLLLLLIIVIH